MIAARHQLFRLAQRIAAALILFPVRHWDAAGVKQSGAGNDAASLAGTP